MSVKFVLGRFAISIVIGLILGAIISEASYYFLKTGETRPPQVVELDIPAGTADRVARGEAVSSIPSNLIFVMGDTLLVKNQDSVPHTLGPLFIPPGSSATMNLNQAQDYTIACSFQPSKYIGLSVQSPLDTSTRLFGIVEAGLPMGLLFAVYSLVAFPRKQKSSE